ncbi:MAG TPA: oligosaccharide flippase family protein [Gemmatales bacterium]|nr:oligosaccharide flippase family protein [Gemmatales bacterium]
MNATGSQSIGKKLLFAVLVLGMGDVVGKAIGLIITVVRTRTLTTAEFGGFGFILQTVSLFAQVAGFSLGLAATRYIALHRNTEPGKARDVAQFVLLLGLATSTVAATLMLLLAPQLASSVPGLTGPLRISVLVLLSQTMSGLVLGVLVGLERFRMVTIATVSQNVVMLVLTIWWAPLFGLTGTLYAMALGFTVALAIALWASRDLFLSSSIHWPRIWSHRAIIWEFCLPSLLSAVIMMPASWAVMAMMASQHGSDLELMAGLLAVPPNWLAGMGMIYHYSTGLRQLAIFYAADQLRPLLYLLSNIVAQPMMPIVTSQIRHTLDPDATPEERETARNKAMNATLRSYQLVVCLVLPAHAVLAYSGPYIMSMFGRTFASEWNVFLLVLALGAFSAITGLMGTVLLAQGRMWLSNILGLVFGLFLIGFCYFLMDWGAVGLGWAYLLTTIATFCISGTVLYQSGLLAWQEVLLIVCSLGWILLISLGAWWLPSSWRLTAIPLAFLLTILILFLMMRGPMMHVLRLVWRRASRMLGITQSA